MTSHFAHLRFHAESLKEHAWLWRLRKADEEANGYNRISGVACKDIAGYVDAFIDEVVKTIDSLPPVAKPPDNISVVLDGSNLREPIAVFSDEKALIDFTTSRGGGLCVRLPFNPPVASEEEQPEAIFLAMTVSRDLVLDTPVQIDPIEESWAILGPHGDKMVMRFFADAVGGPRDWNEAVLKQAMHLVDAGIWLDTHQWSSWFDSIGMEIARDIREGDCFRFARSGMTRISTSGSTLTVKTPDNLHDFDLFPTSTHPNGDGTVKWIMRTILEQEAKTIAEPPHFTG